MQAVTLRPRFSWSIRPVCRELADRILASVPDLCDRLLALEAKLLEYRTARLWAPLTASAGDLPPSTSPNMSVQKLDDSSDCTAAHRRSRVEPEKSGVLGLVRQVLLPDVSDARSRVTGSDLRLVPTHS